MEQTDNTKPTQRRGPLPGLLRSWFQFTADEQKALILILALFLLGLFARWWHLYQKE